MKPSEEAEQLGIRITASEAILRSYIHREIHHNPELYENLYEYIAMVKIQAYYEGQENRSETHRMERSERGE